MADPVLVFDDERSAADFRTYVERAKRIDSAGAIRLQTTGTVLAAWVCAVPGAGLLSDGMSLGLRVFRLAGPVDAGDGGGAGEWYPPLAALTDRFARDTGTAVRMPPVSVHPMWAATSPPRAGWEPVGRIGAGDLTQIAEQGIARVRDGEIAERVWAEPLHDVPGELALTSGAAFAMVALGFAGTDAQLLRAGRWARLSTPAGHVLSR